MFKLRKEPSIGVIELLKSTILGSKGALYQHLNTEERINNLDNPLYLTLERNNKVLGNATFCQRDETWYIRYFAFQSLLQSSGKTKSSSKVKSRIKEELNQILETILKKGFEGGKVTSFYAYVDPKNVKSLWLTEELGFETINQIHLRTFSRVSPTKSTNIVKSNNWNEIPSFIFDRLENKAHYFHSEFKKGNYYIQKDESYEIICFAKVSNADWRIERLPGKLGGVLTKLIPFIPGLNRIIRPKKHSFVIPEGVYVKNDCPKLLTEFFNSILASEKRNLALWWIDPLDELYFKVNDKMSWGILNKLVGVTPVNIISKSLELKNHSPNKPFHISGIDMV